VGPLGLLEQLVTQDQTEVECQFLFLNAAPADRIVGGAARQVRGPAVPRIDDDGAEVSGCVGLCRPRGVGRLRDYGAVEQVLRFGNELEHLVGVVPARRIDRPDESYEILGGVDVLFPAAVGRAIEEGPVPADEVFDSGEFAVEVDAVMRLESYSRG